MTYRGYHAKIGYDKRDHIFVGRVTGVEDFISFHAETKAGLREAFHRAVDNYLEMCWMFGKEAG